MQEQLPSEIRGARFNQGPGFRSAIAPALLYLLHPCSRALYPGYKATKLVTRTDQAAQAALLKDAIVQVPDGIGFFQQQGLLQ